MKTESKVLVAMCAVVIGMYAYMAQSGPLELQSPDAADTYYNLLVQGFRAGQLSLKKEVPPGLARLADPYDPTANAVYRAAPYRLHDLSYYRGRLYLYWGLTPALILFWPFVALTGQYLFHREAVTIFCAVGFLASVGLLCALRRRYFSEVSIWVMAACVVALGLATGVPLLLSRAEVYEVAISCGYMLTMLALWAIWRALNEPERTGRWLVAASVAYGLAVGARPVLLFGAVILLAPVAQAWCERRRVRTFLIAAIGPISLVGAGLMLWNYLRFGNALEFGLRYQLAMQRQVGLQLFSVRYLWFNFRYYFLEPAHWSARFPFVHEAAAPALPPSHYAVEGAFGVLPNIPLVWLALAAPLAQRGRTGQEASTLRWFLMAATLLFGVSALIISFFCYTAGRFEVEFLPALALLAVLGILGLERVLATPGTWLADRPAWKRAVRVGWSLLLVFSVAFNLLRIVGYYAETHYNLGIALANAGKTREAIEQFAQAVRIESDYDQAHVDLANALLHIGKVKEAIDHYEQALRLNPDLAEAHVDFGNALLTQGKGPEAMVHYEEALRINPDYLQAHFNLGFALEKMGRAPEAIEHYKQALKLRPDYAPAKNALTRLGASQ